MSEEAFEEVPRIRFLSWEELSRFLCVATQRFHSGVNSHRPLIPVGVDQVHQVDVGAEYDLRYVFSVGPFNQRD